MPSLLLYALVTTLYMYSGYNLWAPSALYALLAHNTVAQVLPSIVPVVVVTVLRSVMEVSPAALNQRLYRSSVLFLPPVDSGSSQASIIVVLDLLTSLTLSGGDGGTVCVCGACVCVVCMWVCVCACVGV